MSTSLGGLRVALLESRRESELASLVRRHGGEPLCVPALREVPRDCAGEVAHAIDAALRPGALVVLTTGVGLDRCLSVSKELGRYDDLRRALAAATVVCRGPKPIAALKREGLTAHVRAGAPHTTPELIEALDALDVADRDTIFVCDGGSSRAVPDALVRRGARVAEVRPYQWALPEDTGPLRELVAAIVSGAVGALVVTTQAQAKNLFEVASEAGARDALRDALRDRLVLAAVGPTSARALAELGAPPRVVPRKSTMGALVIALGEHVAASAPGGQPRGSAGAG